MELVGLREEVRWLRERYVASQQRACGLMQIAVSSFRYQSRRSDEALRVRLVEADAALVCTEWEVFRKIDWEKAGRRMARKLVIDGRNLYSPKKMRELGFEYYCFGRPE